MLGTSLVVFVALRMIFGVITSVLCSSLVSSSILRISLECYSSFSLAVTRPFFLLNRIFELLTILLRVRDGI